MICPKCGSSAIYAVPDEAPAGVKAWMKCQLCAKRFDPTAVTKVVDDVATIVRAFEEWQTDAAAQHDEDEAVERELELDDDLNELEPPEIVETAIDLAMKDVRVKRAQPKKEKPMGKWSDEARERLRKVMRESHARRKAEGGGAAPSIPKRRGRPPKAVVHEGTATPNGKETAVVLRQTDVRLVRQKFDGSVLAVLDGAIAQHANDLAALQRAKEILERL